MFMKHYAPNRCEPSIEALNLGGGGGSQGRCERRSEVFVKIHFFLGGGGWGSGVRVDVNGEVKSFENLKKNGEGVGLGGQVEVGVRLRWGCQGRCERRSEVFVEIIFFSLGRGVRSGGGSEGSGGGQGRCEHRSEVL